MSLSLRPYQADAIERLRLSLATGHRRPMLQLPTGGGKTLIAATIISSALEKGKRVIFTVPALSLIEQTQKAFWNAGIREIGIIQGNHPETDWSRPVQIASVQTLARRIYPRADLVIVDEAHRWFEFYERWMKDARFVDVPFIGLSATPWTKGLGKYYDDLIIAGTTATMIEQGYLAPFRVFAPAHPDLSGVRTTAGDYNQGDLETALDKPALVADAVETWIRRGEGRPTLCFAVDRSHAKHLQQKFEESGVRCGYLDAYSDLDERNSVKNELERGDINVVCNVGVLTTGVDWKISCIILCRPTKSEMLFTQIIGRGLRITEGYEDCLILDHSDSHSKLGFVTDISHDTLDDGKVKPKTERKIATPLPKECPKCAYLRPAKIVICPSCGFKPERRAGVETEDGELQELTRGGKKKSTTPKGYVKFQGEIISERDFYAQLKHYAVSREYKPGWAANKFRDRTGDWPNSYRDVPAQQPQYEVVSWIKASQIRYAKGRAKASGADQGAPAK